MSTNQYYKVTTFLSKPTELLKLTSNKSDYLLVHQLFKRIIFVTIRIIFWQAIYQNPKLLSFINEFNGFQHLFTILSPKSFTPHSILSMNLSSIELFLRSWKYHKFSLTKHVTNRRTNRQSVHNAKIVYKIMKLKRNFSKSCLNFFYIPTTQTLNSQYENERLHDPSW